MILTLGDLKTLSKDLLDEKGEFWPDAQVVRLANMAGRIVYRQICSIDATHFAQRTSITYPANTENIALNGVSYLNATPYRVLGVSQLETAGSVSQTNMPTELERIDPLETAGYTTNFNDPNLLTTNVWNPRRWALDGQHNLYIVPVATSAVNLYVRWVPHYAEISADSAQVFGGKAPEFHALVVAALTRLMTTKERRMSEEVAAITQWIQTEIRNSERHRSQQPKMRYESPY